MAEQSGLFSLEESLKFAEEAYRKAAKVAGRRGEAMPMSKEEWLRQARERHKVLSNMNQEQLDAAMAEMRQEQLPALMATRDFLDEFISAMKRGQGKKFASKVVKKANKIKTEAKKIARKG